MAIAKNQTQTAKTSIAELIRMGTDNILKPTTKVRPYPCTFKTREELEVDLFYGIITDADCYLLKVVFELGFTQPSFLLHCVRNMARKGDKDALIIEEAGLISDLSKLQNRLFFLMKYHLLFCYEVREEGAKKGAMAKYIFFCSKEGWRAFTYKLDLWHLHREYSLDAIYKPIWEVYRYIGVNVLMHEFSKNENFDKMYSGEKITYTTENKKKKYQDVYGHMMFEDGSGITTHLLLEPFYLSCDGKILTLAENDERLKSRLSNLQTIVKERESADNKSKYYVVLIVENADGMRKYQEYISNQDLSFYREKCFVTSENAVFSAGLAGGDGTDSVLRLELVEQKFKWFQGKLPGTK